MSKRRAGPFLDEACSAQGEGRTLIINHQAKHRAWQPGLCRGSTWYQVRQVREGLLRNNCSTERKRKRGKDGNPVMELKTVCAKALWWGEKIFLKIQVELEMEQSGRDGLACLGHSVGGPTWETTSGKEAG